MAFIRSGQSLPGDELLTTDLSGERWSRLWHTPNSSGFFGALSWAGDGSRLAVTVTPTDFDELLQPYVATLSAAGGRPLEVRGTKGGALPVFSPDGRSIAFTRLRFRANGRRVTVNTALWLADAHDGGSRRLVRSRRNVALLPFSFSPDGSKLAAVRERAGQPPEIVAIPLGGGPPALLFANGVEPAFSPDGSKIAFVRPKRVGSVKSFGRFPLPVWGGDLFVAALDGSSLQRVTYSPGRREVGPDWDPSGERLAFTQLGAERTVAAMSGDGSAIVEVNADGTCRHRLLFTYGLSYSDPAWRPGPGRGAGRIEC